MTYAELVQAIKDYTQNTEITFVGNIDNFIRGAEDRVYGNVQVPSFFRSDITVTAGGTRDYTVDGMIEVFDVRLDSSGAAGTGWTTLLRKDWDFLREAYPDTSSSTGWGQPRYWSISNAARVSEGVDPDLTIRIAPTPGAAYGLDIDYYGKIVADMLKAAASGTWLSVTWPNVLLYGCLVEAYTFMKGEPDLVQFYDTRFKEGIEKIGMISSGEQRNRLKPPMRV